MGLIKALDAAYPTGQHLQASNAGHVAVHTQQWLFWRMCSGSSADLCAAQIVEYRFVGLVVWWFPAFAGVSTALVWFGDLPQCR